MRHPAWLALSICSGCAIPIGTPTEPSSPGSKTRVDAGAPSTEVQTVRTDGRSYDFDDLEALRDSKSWHELLEHVEDVAPSERNDRWRELTIDAIVGTLASVPLDDATAPRLAAEVEHLAGRYDFIAKAGPFRSAAGAIVTRAAGVCGTPSLCGAVLRLAQILRASEVASQSARAAAKSGERALALALHTTEPDDKILCADDHALALMMEGVAQPPDSSFHKGAAELRSRCRAHKEGKR